MHLASLLFGGSIIVIAIGLESHRRKQELVAGGSTDLDRTYITRRRRGRVWTNALLGLIGAMAGIAGVAGTGGLWMILWTIIPLIVFFLVALAFGDALRTDRYLRDKLPELKEQTLGVARRAGGVPAEGVAGVLLGDRHENRS